MTVFDKKKQTQATTSPRDKYVVSKPPFPFRRLQKYNTIIILRLLLDPKLAFPPNNRPFNTLMKVDYYTSQAMNDRESLLSAI